MRKPNQLLRSLGTLALLGLACGLTSACGPTQSQTSSLAQLQNYKRFLVVSHVESYYNTEPRSRVGYPLVKGLLTNLGSQSLDVVEFTVKFKNLTNQVIYEERVYPVFKSDFSQAELQGPFSTGRSSRFAFKFPACPKDWQPGQVIIEVTKIVFHKEPGSWTD